MRASGRRRWPLLAAAAICVVAVLAAAGWFFWFPTYRPRLRTGEVYGVDVSAHQGAIDWPRVAGDEMTFAYIKATEGGDFVDRRFHENWDGAGAAGLDRGAYHFFTLCRPGREQAANFLDVVPVGELELPPAVDLEFAGNCGDRPSPERLFAEIDAFIEIVEAEAARPVILYVLPDFDDRYDVSRRYKRGRWVRRIPLRPHGDWSVWQFTGFGRVAGVRGDVDINVMRGS